MNTQNPQTLLNNFQSFMNNPNALLSKLGIPSNMASDPDKTARYLLDSGRITQAQYNQARQMAQGLMGHR